MLGILSKTYVLYQWRSHGNPTFVANLIVYLVTFIRILQTWTSSSYLVRLDCFSNAFNE